MPTLVSNLCDTSYMYRITCLKQVNFKHVHAHECVCVCVCVCVHMFVCE